MPETKQPPPITTCDGTAVKVGMAIYYAQECCNIGKPYQVHQGKVIDLDLSRRRSIRVRKKSGREVVLSMSSSGGICAVDGRRDREVIFAKKAGAIALAKELSMPMLEDLQKELIDLKGEASASQVVKQAAIEAGTLWAKERVKKANEKVAAFKKSMQGIGK